MKNTKTKLLSLVFILALMLVFALAVNADDRTSVETWDISATSNDNVIANLYNDPENEGMYTLEITGTGRMKNWSENSAPWYPNYWENISTVIINSSVTNIGSYTFNKCSNIRSITISDSVTEIEEYAFCGCSSLKSVTIPKSVTCIRRSAFAACSNLISVDIDSSSNLSVIDSNCFNACSLLTNITLPNNLGSIGQYAFYGCSKLKSINIPSSVKRIYRSAFDYSSVNEVHITDITAWHKIYFEGPESNPLSFGDLYLNGEIVTELVIPSEVTSIESYTFYSCLSLISVTIPTNVSSIGTSAFNYCSNLKLVTINNSTIASQLTSTSSCGYLINYADTVLINSNITEIGSYLTNTSNFAYTDTISVYGTDYKVFSKHSHDNMSIAETVNPTFTRVGYNVYKCDSCELTKTEEIPMLVLDENYKFVTIGLTLGEDINMVYKATIPEGYENPYVIFTFNGNETAVTSYTIEESTGRYVFKFTGIRPQYMGDNVRADLRATYKGAEASRVNEAYSVKKYCEAVLNLDTAGTKLKTMLSDLLILGEKAQLYTGYKTDELVTNGLTLVGSEYNGVSDSENALSVNGADSDIASWSSVSLLVGNAMTVQYKLKITEPENVKIQFSIGDRVETFNASELEYDEKSQVYILELRNIKVIEYGEAITGIILYNDEQIGKTLTYSVNSYIYAQQNVANEKLQAFLRALYIYGKSTKTYTGK
ncbi:MAG: leucine-rich repeat domain-containing protein [Clostridia bacterium]|nr:leucine-rich repeat domain-containing protein [Clostridia bacterium]